MMNGPVLDFKKNFTDIRMAVRITVGEISSDHAFDDAFFIDVFIL